MSDKDVGVRDVGSAFFRLIVRIIEGLESHVLSIVLFFATYVLHKTKYLLQTDSNVFNVCLDGFVYALFGIGAFRMLKLALLELFSRER